MISRRWGGGRSYLFTQSCLILEMKFGHDSLMSWTCPKLKIKTPELGQVTCSSCLCCLFWTQFKMLSSVFCWVFTLPWSSPKSLWRSTLRYFNVGTYRVNKLIPGFRLCFSYLFVLYSHNNACLEFVLSLRYWSDAVLLHSKEFIFSK